MSAGIEGDSSVQSPHAQSFQDGGTNTAFELRVDVYMIDLDSTGWETLPLLKRRIASETGLDCTHFKEKYLKRRIAVRMRAWGIEDCATYSRILSNELSEKEMLLKDLTINVTNFFRDPPVFKAFEKDILPEIIAESVENKRRSIRLWSAGCASGEEPYSLGMLMHSSLGSRMNEYFVSILGTDIDSCSLDAALKAEYNPNEIEGVPPNHLRRYFNYDGTRYSLVNDIRKLVRFKHLDLFSDGRLPHFETIFCRNVIIYFSREMQNKLFTRFYDVLTPNGYLVLGKTEMLTGSAKDLFKVVNARERIYQKLK